MAYIKNFCVEGKSKGYITLFIIFAIIVAFCFMFIFFISGSLQDKNTDTTIVFVPIIQYIESVLKESLEESIGILGSNGGLNNFDDLNSIEINLMGIRKNISKGICNLEGTPRDCLVPMVQIEEGLSSFLITLFFEKLDLEQFEERGFEFEYSFDTTYAASFVSEREVFTIFFFDIHVKKGRSEMNNQVFSTRSSSNIGQLANISKEIVHYLEQERTIDLHDYHDMNIDICYISTDNYFRLRHLETHEIFLFGIDEGLNFLIFGESTPQTTCSK